MLCEHCNKNVATVHLIEIINQEKKEVNLCENCAQEAGLPFTKSNFSVSELFGLVEAGIQKNNKSREEELQCPQCGITLREFRSKGRFGCAFDYEFFRPQLEGLLEKIHGSARHTGRKPKAAVVRADAAPQPQQEELETLRKRLTHAIHEEAYEEAAKLRDRISDLEKKSRSNQVKPG